MDPRDASVDLLYQEHLLQWMTVGDLLGDLVGRMETHHGGRCGKRSICIAAEGHRRFAAREGLTILRELADENSVISLVARASSVGKQMLAEFWLPKLDAKLAAPVRVGSTGLASFPGDSGLGLTLRVVQAMQSE